MMRHLPALCVIAEPSAYARLHPHAVCAKGYGGPVCAACARGTFSAGGSAQRAKPDCTSSVSYTHLRAHETSTDTLRLGATSASDCTGGVAAREWGRVRGGAERGCIFLRVREMALVLMYVMLLWSCPF